MTPRPRAAVLAALLLTLAALLLSGAAAAAKEVPYLSGRVVDEAGIVPPDAASRIEGKLRAFEEETGAQVAVLTVPSLEGEVLENYSLKVAETWGLGRKSRDDGVLLLVARDDRQLRIEVGYGLEGALTDAEAGRIVRNVIVPRFKAGDYGGGIEAGVDAVVGTIRGEEGLIPEDTGPIEGAPPDLAGRLMMALVFFPVVGVFSAIALFGKGCQSWFLYVFLIPFWTAFPFFIFGVAGVVLGLAWIVLFPIVRLFLGRSPRGKRLVRTTPWLQDLSTWAATSSSRGGGFGGGGFSGGGGSFGGGGASGSW
ncbi:MAG TPA: TPM domain-containing protein [Thermoanaerobaculia bacterium]|nr:TPM domain-containing protein [Thermoanaerobaculia bacterium]